MLAARALRTRCVLALCAGLALLGAAPADTSLTTEAYVRRGMPKPDHAWSKSERAQATRALRALDLAEYPRHASARSGEVFARLSAVPTWDRSASLDLRVAAARQGFEALSDVLTSYQGSLIAEQGRGLDVVEIRAALLRTLAASMSFAGEQGSLDGSDVATTVEAMRRGFLPELQASFYLGEVLGVLSGRSELGAGAYDADELCRLVDALRATLPAILPSVVGRSGIVDAIRELEQDPQLDDLDPELRLLRREVEAVADALPPQPEAGSVD